MIDPTKRVDDAIDADATDAEIERLAKLTLLQYEKERKGAAEKLDLRASMLDRLVAAKRAELGLNDKETQAQGEPISFPEPEPWPDEVNGAILLSEIATAVRDYVVMPDHTRDACALWVVYTYLVNNFLIAPRLAIRSPVPECGKTTLLDTLEHMVLKPLRTSSVTASVTFRVIAMAQPTLLIDEAKNIADKPDLLEVLNDGHRRGGKTLRTVGDNHEPRAFSTFSGLAIALIGSLPAELHGRSVVVDLKRRLRGETTQEMRAGPNERLETLGRKAARWAQDNAECIAAMEPTVPSVLFNRVGDNWRPLLAIADAAAGEWPERARKAAEAAYATAAGDDEALVELLLADIRDIAKGKISMPSADLVKALVGLEGRPWAELGKSRKPLTQNGLARMLKPLKITTEGIWLGSTTGRMLNGYVFRHFEEAFARYLPPLGSSQPQGRKEADETGTSEPFQTARLKPDLADGKCEKPNNDGPPCDLVDEKGVGRGKSTEMRPGLPLGARPATNGRAAPGAFIDAKGKPTDDPELGYYGRAARAPIDAAYQVATEKQPDAVADVPDPAEKAPPAADVIDEADQAKREAVAETAQAPASVTDQPAEAADAQQIEAPPVSAAAPVPSVPVRPQGMLEGDWQRLKHRLQNQRETQRATDEAKARAGLH